MQNTSEVLLDQIRQMKFSAHRPHVWRERLMKVYSSPLLILNMVALPQQLLDELSAFAANCRLSIGEVLLKVEEEAHEDPVPWTIGATQAITRNGGYPRTWNGVIDEVKLYNTPLSNVRHNFCSGHRRLTLRDRRRFNRAVVKPDQRNHPGPLGTGITANDDTAPSLLISNFTTQEGNSGTTPMDFKVTLSRISGAPTSVNFITVDSSAKAGTDFNGVSGTVTIPAGATTAMISIAAFGDVLFEQNESFFVNLSLSANASIADAQGKGVIENDDAQPSLSVNDISIFERDSGMTNAEFMITLSAPSGLETTVRVQTANDSANFKKDDYVRTIQTVTISSGQTECCGFRAGHRRYGS